MREDNTPASPGHYVCHHLALTRRMLRIAGPRRDNDAAVRIQACCLRACGYRHAAERCRLAEEARRSCPILRVGEVDEQ